MLSEYIQKAASFHKLCCVVHEHGGRFNAFHISAALVRMAKLARERCSGDAAAVAHYGRGRGPKSQGAALHSESEGNAPLPGKMKSSSRSAAAATEPTNLPAVSSLVSELLRAVQPRILEFDSQGVVNVLHSLAKLRQLDVQAATGEEEEDRGNGWQDGSLEHGQPQASRPRSRLLPPLSEGSLLSSVCGDLLYVSTQLLGSFSPQAFSNLAYAIAVLGLRPQRQWMLAFCRQSMKLLPEFSTQSLSNTIWAFAKLVGP